MKPNLLHAVVFVALIIGSPFSQSAEPPAVLPSRLIVEVKTSTVNDAGTDADIWMAMTVNVGGNVNTTTFMLTGQGAGNANQKGKTTTYNMPTPIGNNLQFLSSVVLINGMNGDSPGWHVENVKIVVEDTKGEKWTILDNRVNRWLDTKEKVGPALGLSFRLPLTK